MSDETFEDVETETCASCGEEFPEELMEYSEHLGATCQSCLRRRYPDHVTIGDDVGHPSDDSVTYALVDGGIVAIHGPTGIAAFCGKHPTELGNRRAAKRLLQKVYADVSRLESNERYGNIME